MSAEREELARAVATCLEYTDSVAGIVHAANLERADILGQFNLIGVAEALIAAGYRKPRIITTIEELNALPEHSIIRDPDGSTGELHDGESWDVPRVIFWCGNECEDVPDARLNLPATVLYVPNEEK